MKRLVVIAATAALAASFVLTAPAGAGGAATVTVVGPASEPVVGVPWPLELEVLQHGITPIDWEHVSVVARQPSSGLVAAANAHPDDTVGRYLVDMVFPEAMRTLEEFAAVREAVDVPILANMTEFGKSDLFTVDQLRDVGVNIVIWPVSLLRMAMGAAERALDTLIDDGHLTSRLGEMQHRADLYDLIDYESYNHFDTNVFTFRIDR